MANYEQVGTITISPTLISDKEQEYPINKKKNQTDEALIVDISDLIGSSINDITVGDAIRNAVRNGQRVCLFKNDTYYYPTFIAITSTDGSTDSLTMYVYGLDTNGATVNHLTYHAVTTKDE